MRESNLWFNKAGEPITSEQGAKLHMDYGYRTIGDDYVKGLHISTVWLGISHSFSGGPPIIFETMVFGAEGQSLKQRRYHTEAEARKGHKEMVKLAREGSH